MMPQFSPGYLSDHIDYSFKSVLLKLFVRNLQVELIIDYLIKKKKNLLEYGKFVVDGFGMIFFTGRHFRPLGRLESLKTNQSRL